MSNVVIRVEGLSKRYRIGQRERYYALRDVLARAFTTPFRRLKQISKFAFRHSKLNTPLTHRSNTTPAGCVCALPLPSLRIWTRRFCWWTRCWR